MMSQRREVEVVVLDMGGVILEMGPAGGLPFGPLEAAGRAALLERGAGSGLTACDLDVLVFDGWRRGYAQRRTRGAEEPFEPHLGRLVDQTGVALEALLEAYTQPYSEWLAELDGAGAAIRAIVASGYRLAIVSNVPLPGRVYRRALARLGLDACFADRRFSHDEGSRKPDPTMLRRVLAALGVEPSRAVMVGDRKVEDVGSGQSVGTHTVWLESSFDQGPEPDATIPDLAALPRLLAAWART